MLTLPPGISVLVATARVDGRKGIDGLAAIVRSQFAVRSSQRIRCRARCTFSSRAAAIACASFTSTATGTSW